MSFRPRNSAARLLSNGEQVNTFHTYYDGDTLEAIAVELRPPLRKSVS